MFRAINCNNGELLDACVSIKFDNLFGDSASVLCQSSLCDVLLASVTNSSLVCKFFIQSCLSMMRFHWSTKHFLWFLEAQSNFLWFLEAQSNVSIFLKHNAIFSVFLKHEAIFLINWSSKLLSLIVEARSSLILWRSKESVCELFAVGFKLSDDDIIIAALNGLPPEFDMIKTVLIARETPITLKEFRAQLLYVEKNIESIMIALDHSMTGMMSANSFEFGSSSHHQDSSQTQGTVSTVGTIIVHSQSSSPMGFIGVKS